MRLGIQLFADGASIKDFQAFAKNDTVDGYTTNPSLMKKAGVTDYKKFISEVLPLVNGKSISFEVIADDFPTMLSQAKFLSSQGKNVFVKIPIMNTKGISSLDLIRELILEGIKVNVTAIMLKSQVDLLANILDSKLETIISVFAGRIADTGVDPVPVMSSIKGVLNDFASAKLLWASPRELLNIYQAKECGCDIITVPPDILKKLSLTGKDLFDYSRETVQMFFDDATSSGLTL